MTKTEVIEYVKELMERVRNTPGMCTINNPTILEMLNKIYSKIVMIDNDEKEDNKITYFKKSIEDMDVHALASMPYKSRCCPFPSLLCYNCDFLLRT